MLGRLVGRMIVAGALTAGLLGLSSPSAVAATAEPSSARMASMGPGVCC
jgi:hypothetical protein